MGYKTFKIMQDVTLIRDNDVCIYLVEGENSAIVIDTGYGFFDLKSKAEEITDKPLAAVFTHGHIDHAFGGHYFDRVFMSREDLPVYEKHTDLKKQMVNGEISDFIKKLGLSKAELEAWSRARPDKIEFVAHGDTFDIGGNLLEFITLKGHTPGSIGILDRKHRILFSGDGVINHVWMQLPESGTIDEYLRTLNSLDTYLTDFDFICTGHSKEPMPADFIGKMKLTLSELLEGAVGTPYENPVAGGMIYRQNGCEVVYLPERIK
ncbi:MAG: beta-lactamase domain protein [Eubacterium sp.]|jgi:glyoxylase-like metal-dependent hydrolase (beta-lactamase superfamily II)|nr:beta-lactamase domain protein [Eubacterium sp.]